MKQVNPFYRGRRWERKRANILRRDEYMCRECRRYGKTTAANTIHHCYPLDEYPELNLHSINLISLCVGCHGQMHNRIDNTITDKGKEWQDRIKDKIE